MNDAFLLKSLLRRMRNEQYSLTRSLTDVLMLLLCNVKNKHEK